MCKHRHIYTKIQNIIVHEITHFLFSNPGTNCQELQKGPQAHSEALGNHWVHTRITNKVTNTIQNWRGKAGRGKAGRGEGGWQKGTYY